MAGSRQGAGRALKAAPGGKADAPSSPTSFLDALDGVSEAVESGAGLPSVARAAGRALSASVIVLDASSSVLAVACASREDERAVMAGEGGTETLELLVADAPVGRLRYRPRAEPPPSALLRLVANLIALELERVKAPERASEAAVGDFLADLLARRLTDSENILARASELGCDLSAGACALVVRARPQQPEETDWRARVLTIAERGARGDRAQLAGGAGRGRLGPAGAAARAAPTASS